MLLSTRDILNDIIPPMYSELAEHMGMPRSTNLARSNQCHVLTKNLLQALKARNLDARREYHETGDGRWHYLIAHHPAEAEPSDNDLITDLNPWQYVSHPAAGNYLHGERHEVQTTLREANAPEWFVSLRGIATIIDAHRTA